MHSRILLVEDNEINQIVAREMLKHAGHMCDTARNGREAIEALSRFPYELVLMDIEMPEMNGYETTKAIRDAESPVLNHDVPIIAITAYALSDDEKNCLEAGMNAYLTKPLQADRFLPLVELFLSGTVYKAPVYCQDGREETAAKQKETKGIIDIDEFLYRIDGNTALAKKLFGHFFEELPAKVAAIREALDMGDAEETAKRVHALNGASGNISAHELRCTVMEMETALREKNLDSGNRLYRKLLQDIEELKTALTRLRFLN